MNACTAQQSSRSSFRQSTTLSHSKVPTPLPERVACIHSIAGSTSGDIASNVRMAADSTMLRIVNLLIALSLGTQRAQLEQRTGLTWPRPFLLRPLLGETNQVSFPDSKKKIYIYLCRNRKRFSAAIMNTVGDSRYVTRRPSFFFFFGGGPYKVVEMAAC